MTDSRRHSGPRLGVQEVSSLVGGGEERARALRAKSDRSRPLAGGGGGGGDICSSSGLFCSTRAVADTCDDESHSSEESLHFRDRSSDLGEASVGLSRR